MRQCPCPVPSWFSCSRAELWSCPKKEARDGEVLRLQLACLYKLPLGRIFCPKPWAGGFVPWEECLAFGCHWFMSCLSLYQPCLCCRAGTVCCKFLQIGWKTATANLGALPFHLPVRTERSPFLFSDHLLPAKPEQCK